MLLETQSGSVFMLTTSFQICNDLLQLFNFFSRKFFPAQQSSKQLIRRTIVNFVNQFIRFSFLYFFFGNKGMADYCSLI